ncbi:hypothetical protein GCM10017774_38830 [Lentzea cavernae]|uniref:Uncharacterized protein n=1 Tax=Lentzea cavernae TaxID=2020703 RepID=A0ABQ3MLF3_9PSEU|nr:hypothetical protein GCM10017774_38830 [Lentzea cavernae]
MTALGPLGRAHAQSGWSWQFFTYGNDIWQRAYWNNTEQFDYRLGGGGCVREMRYCPETYRALLSPSFQGEETDRVMQAVLWALNVQGTSAAPDKRWNVDQAGNHAGEFSRTVAVERPSSTTTDVWTIADRQWFPQLDADFAGSDPVPQLTRYTRLTGGALQIRRVVRLPRIVKSGSVVPDVEFYLENWLPFLRSAHAFDAVAFSLNGDGSPAEWYRAGYNIPSYPWTPATETSGYAMVFKENATTTRPNVAVVHSRKAGVTQSTTARMDNVRNSMDWNTGIGVLPGVRVFGGEPGSILDHTLRIVPNGSTSAALVADLNAQTAEVPAPVLYGPTHPFTGELSTVVSQLRALTTSTAGARIGNLAPLLR